MLDSLRKLPWQEFTSAAQIKIKEVVSRPPLFHRMPQQKVYADPEICTFLISHPDVVIGFWEQLGSTQLSLMETKENNFILKETTGTTANIQVLFQKSGLCVAYAQGEYRGPLLSKSYQGDVLLILRAQFTRDALNEPIFVCDLDTFVQIHHLGADILAKLFFPSMTQVADGNFEVTLAFLSQISDVASRNPEGLKRTAGKITSIRQDVYEGFCDAVDKTAIRYARRNRFEPYPSIDRREYHREEYVRQQEPDRTEMDYDGEIESYLVPPDHWGLNHLTDTPSFFHEDESRKEKISNKTVSDESIDLRVPETMEKNFTVRNLPKLPLPTKKQ